MPEGQTAPPPLPKSQPSFGKRYGTMIKLLGVGALVLILLIPLAMITGVLRERLQRRNEAVADITSSWGGEQNVIGRCLGSLINTSLRWSKKCRHLMGRWSDAKWKKTVQRLHIFFPKRYTLPVTSRRRCYIAASTMRQFFARRLRSRASLRRRILGRLRSM